MTKLQHHIIAYLPWENPALEQMTRRALMGAENIGFPYTLWHASDPPNPSALCEELHPRLTGGRPVQVIDYENGSLAGNWAAMLWQTFKSRQTDWCLFTSNDLYWRPEALEAIIVVMGAGDPMTLYIAEPMSGFLIHRALWSLIGPSFETGYLPSGFEDGDFVMTVLKEGGDYDVEALKGTYDHGEGQATIRNLGERKYHRGDHARNFERNREHFVHRWGFTPEARWPPPHRGDPELVNWVSGRLK